MLISIKWWALVSYTMPWIKISIHPLGKLIHYDKGFFNTGHRSQTKRKTTSLDFSVNVESFFFPKTFSKLLLFVKIARKINFFDRRGLSCESVRPSKCEVRSLARFHRLFWGLSCVYFGDVKRDVACDVTPYILTLSNRNVIISVSTPKVAKASTIVAVVCHCCHCCHLKYNANLNYPLSRCVFVCTDVFQTREQHLNGPNNLDCFIILD